MKTFSFLKAAFLIAAIPFLFGCEKEDLSEMNVTTESQYGKTDNGVERPFKGRFVSNTTLVPDLGAGNSGGDLVPAWYPGIGEGNVTHMGKFTVYFNQYASALNADGSVTITGAPVNMFFEEQLFNEDGKYSITVPNEVSYVLVDKQGNSIWAKPGGIGYEYQFTEGATRLVIKSQAEIIGGTGRFAGATGLFTVSGYSDLDYTTGTSIDVLRYDGVIIY